MRSLMNCRLSRLCRGVFICISTFFLTASNTVADEHSFWAQKYLTGDWGGLRTQLEEYGVTLGGSYEMGYSKNTRGGVDTSGDSNKQRFTLNADFNFEKLFDWKGARVFFQYQNHTGAFADEVGDIQQFDGLDDPEYDRIHMFWFEQWLFDEKMRVKIGKVEPKSEFFAPLNAKNHLGFSTERSPTIGHGPPADSVNLFFYPTQEIQLSFGMYDAAFNEGRDENDFDLHSIFDPPADAFYIGEGSYSWAKGTEDSGRFMAGFWRLEGDVGRFDGGNSESSTDGAYFVLDQTVYKENAGDKNCNQGIGFYLQYGFADEDVRAIKSHYGGGFQWTGAIDGRDSDVFGMGISNVELSDEPGAGFSDNNECAYEIFYKAAINNYMILQGDAQYIQNSGGVSRSDALVLTLRLTILL